MIRHPTQPAAQWRRRKAARPGEIATAALACFAERGFAATRLDDIAARAGITRGTLYLYFDSKEELFKAVVRQSISPVLTRVGAIIAASTAPTPVLLRQVGLAIPQAILDTQVSALPKLVLSEASNFPEIARFYLSEVVRPAKSLIAGLVRRGIAQGEFRAVDVESTVLCMIAPILFSALWRHSFEPHDDAPLDVTALAETHVDLLLHGLMPTGERP
jgi:AcrR family transcriptional regulator